MDQLEAVAARFPYLIQAGTALATLLAVVVALVGLRASGRHFRVVASAELMWGRLIAQDLVMRSGRDEGPLVVLSVRNHSTFPLGVVVTSLEHRGFFGRPVSILLPSQPFFAERRRDVAAFSQTTIPWIDAQTLYERFSEIGWWERRFGHFVFTVSPDTQLRVKVGRRLHAHLRKLAPKPAARPAV